MTRYNDRGYCSSCQEWIPKERLLQVKIQRLGGVIVYYCKIHKKQVRLKARSTPMSTVKR